MVGEVSVWAHSTWIGLAILFFLNVAVIYVAASSSWYRPSYQRDRAWNWLRRNSAAKLDCAPSLASSI